MQYGSTPLDVPGPYQTPGLPAQRGGGRPPGQGVRLFSPPAYVSRLGRIEDCVGDAPPPLADGNACGFPSHRGR